MIKMHIGRVLVENVGVEKVQRRGRMNLRRDIFPTRVDDASEAAGFPWE